MDVKLNLIGGCLCASVRYTASALPFAAEYLTLTIASLDDHNLVVPSYHIFTEAQIQWFSIDDDCKRYPKSRKN